jgi:sugar (pentulose or hexulose) kinase
VQECLRVWNERGLLYRWEDLTAAAAKSMPLRSFIDPDHPEFSSPGDMPESIRSYCAATGQAVPQTTGEVVRCCLESLCMSYRLTLDRIEQLTQERIEVVRVVGGGSRNKFLCRMIADACNRCAISGPAEASALGNALLQLIAIGEIADLSEGRQIIAQSYPQEIFPPDDSAAWHEAYERFCGIVKKEAAVTA